MLDTLGLAYEEVGPALFGAESTVEAGSCRQRSHSHAEITSISSHFALQSKHFVVFSLVHSYHYDVFREVSDLLIQPQQYCFQKKSVIYFFFS